MERGRQGGREGKGDRVDGREGRSRGGREEMGY